MSLSICSILRLDVPLLLTLACVSTCSPISPRRPAADNPLLDARDFLSHFLSTMNLTDRRPLAPRREPPEYMLELYRRFTQDYTAAPSAGVVRSFKNEGRTFTCFHAAGMSGKRSEILLDEESSSQRAKIFFFVRNEMSFKVFKLLL